MKKIHSWSYFAAILFLLFLLCGQVWAESTTETQTVVTDESPWKSIDDLPPNIRIHVDALYAARNRKFTALDGKVEKFSVDQLTVPDAVAKLSNDNNVLCGIEVIPWQSSSKELKSFVLPRVSLSLENTTPRQILNKLISLDPTFTWVEDQGIANVIIRSAYDSPTYPLNLTVDKFSVTDRPYSNVFIGQPHVWGLFQLPQVAPAIPIGHTGKWPTKFEPQVTFEMRGASVRKITNRVAREVGMSWSLVWNDCLPPERGKSTAMFWMIPNVWVGLRNGWKGLDTSTTGDSGETQTVVTDESPWKSHVDALYAAQRPPSMQWQFDSSGNMVYKVMALPDAGAYVAVSCNSSDTAPGNNVVYRIAPDGTVLWTYSNPENWRLSFEDATPDGKSVLAALIPEDDRESMKLLLLSATGETTKETQLMEDSHWVWLSPDGKLLLRWVNSKKNLLMEELMSGKIRWSLKDLPQTVHLENLQKSDMAEEAGFVQPVWQAGCVLIGDRKNGNIEAISIPGKHLWRLPNMKWYPPAKSPVLAGPSGKWLAAMSTSMSIVQPGKPEVEYFSLYNAEGPEEPKEENTLKLMSIRMSGDNLGEQDQAGIKWRRTISGQGRRSGVSGGPVINLDLFERQEQGKSFPSLTILTGTGLVTLAFDELGNLKEEVFWYVPNIAGVFEAWLLPSNRLLIKRPNTTVGPQALQIIDRTGAVLWEIKPREPIQSVSFDPERRHMTVNMLHTVRGYQLN